MLALMSEKSSRERAAPIPSENCLLSMTVAAASTTSLRQLASRLCGDKLQFTRLKTCRKGRRMQVSLCVPAPLVDTLADAIVRFFPDVIFGACSKAGVHRTGKKIRTARILMAQAANKTEPPMRYDIQW